MAIYSFVKETNGFSITKDGLKVRYGGVSYRSFPKGNVAQIQMHQFSGGLSDYDIDLSNDSVTINGVEFNGTATELLDDLGDTVLFIPANGEGGAVSAEGYAEIQSDISDLDALKVDISKSQTRLYSGKKGIVLGDSITNGSSASGGFSFVDQLLKLIGTGILTSLVEKGEPGHTTAQMFARYQSDVRNNGAGVLFLLCGANDVSTGRTLAQWSADIVDIANETKKDGIPLIIGTVPPRAGASSTTATKALITQYNLWLSMWAPANGVIVADVWKYLSLQPTGEDMNPVYNVDGVHPNTLGHQEIANAFAEAFAPIGKAEHLVTGVNALNLVTNPVFAGGALTPWYETPNGTGSSITYSTESDTTGKLKYGNWQVCDFDAVVSGGQRLRACSFPVVAGQEYLVTGRLDYENVVGTFKDYAAAGSSSAQFNMYIANQANVNQLMTVGYSVLPPGPVVVKFTVPAGMTHMIIYFRMVLPTGLRVKFKFGEIGAFKVSDLQEIKNLLI